MELNNNMKEILGDPKKAIKKLTYPIIISMLLTMANNIIDGVWVAGLGPSPLAAIGFVTPLFLILVGIGTGFGAGVNSLISRYVGSKNQKKANEAAVQSVVLGIIVSIIVTIIFIAILEPILYIMGAGEVINYALEYAIPLFVFSIVTILPVTYAGIFRAEGDIKRATIPMCISAILNMVLDPIFIYVFNLGVMGASIATVISIFIELLLILHWMFIKKDTYFKYSFKKFKINLGVYKEILNVGIPAGIEELLMAVVAIVINLILEIVGGTNSVAIYTIVMRLASIAIMPTIGIATSTITVVGIAYGARNYENIKIATRYSVKLGFIFSIILSLVFIVFSNQIAYLFSYSANSSIILAPTISYILKYIWLFIIPVAFGATASYAFQGMGKGLASFILTMQREAILVIIFAALLGMTLDLGVRGVYYGVVIGDAIGSLVGILTIEIFISRLLKKVSS